MERLLVAVLLLLVLLFVLRKRQSSCRTGCQSRPSPVTAAEAEPTSTGRYRVQKMLAAQASKEDISKEGDSSSASTEEEALPDPFDPAGSKKK